LIPVAPPPDQPTRETYQIFHDVLGAAILEWRNQFTRAAERAEAEARAEEQRLRAEQEAEAAARLRKQRRMLSIALGVAAVLLIAVLGLGIYTFVQRRQIQQTAQLIDDFRKAFAASMERLQGLVDQQQVAQAKEVASLKEANQLRDAALAKAMAGDSKSSKALLARADVATATAGAAQAEYQDYADKIAKEQKIAADAKARADELSKKLPTGGGLVLPGGTNINVPKPPDPKPPDPKPPDPKPEDPKPEPPKPKGDFMEPYRKAMDAKNRGRWAEARPLLEQAIQLNGVDSAERITISGFGNFEPYVPKYYLGLALKNAGDCAGAQKYWKLSEQDGKVQGTSIYRSTQKERAGCKY
jgi:hypothetical protein